MVQGRIGFAWHRLPNEGNTWQVSSTGAVDLLVIHCACQIQALDRLYTLYVNVIGTIKGYGDLLWVDVVDKIDEMGEQVLLLCSWMSGNPEVP